MTGLTFLTLTSRCDAWLREGSGGCWSCIERPSHIHLSPPAASTPAFVVAAAAVASPFLSFPLSLFSSLVVPLPLIPGLLPAPPHPGSSPWPPPLRRAALLWERAESLGSGIGPRREAFSQPNRPQTLYSFTHFSLFSREGGGMAVVPPKLLREQTSQLPSFARLPPNRNYRPRDRGVGPPRSTLSSIF